MPSHGPSLSSVLCYTLNETYVALKNLLSKTALTQDRGRGALMVEA